MTMEARDSQLSDIIKEGRMDLSQKNGTFDEFSQNTKVLIESGSYILPELSQGGVAILENATKEMKDVCHSIEMSVLDDNFNERVPDLNSTTYIGGGARPPILKRTRTNRIFDKPSPKSSETEKDLESIEPTVSPNLNKSQDLFNTSLMETSFESEMTFTQTRLDSQSPILYLRNRTAEEQERHKREKQKKKENKDSVENVVKGIQLHEPPQLKMEVDEDERDIFADDDWIDRAEPKNEPFRATKCELDDEFLVISVNETKTKKISDFVSKKMDNGDTFLWAKMDCLVPIEIRWKISPSRKHETLILKARLVHYDSKTLLDQALTDPWSDVRKCRDHTEHETSGYPTDSFFYMCNSSVDWFPPPQDEQLTREHYFQAALPGGQNRIDCDLKFRCQEKCMNLQDKRKTMCFVVFLEDEKGKTLYHSLFKEVRVVAYPRRDFKNFNDKNWNGINSSEVTPSSKRNSCTPRPKFSFGDDKHMNMFAEGKTELKMFPSLSFARKRGVSEFEPTTSSSSSFSNYATPSSSRSNDYERRMMLGGSYKPPQIVEEMEISDNYRSTPKRQRVSMEPLINVVVTQAEYQILVASARSARSKAARVMSSQVPPLLAQCQTTPETSISEWLTSIGKQPCLPYFERNGILTVSDLITAFEKDKEIFENIGLDSQLIPSFHYVFLNFYRIFDAERRTDNSESHGRHQNFNTANSFY